MVDDRVEFGSKMVMVCDSSLQFLIALSVTTSKGRPSRML